MMMTMCELGVTFVRLSVLLLLRTVSMLVWTDRLVIVTLLLQMQVKVRRLVGIVSCAAVFGVSLMLMQSGLAVGRLTGLWTLLVQFVTIPTLMFLVGCVIGTVLGVHLRQCGVATPLCVGRPT